MKDIIKNDPVLAGFADLLEIGTELAARMMERAKMFIVALHGGRLIVNDDEFRWMYARGMDIVLLKEEDERQVKWITIHGVSVSDGMLCVIDENGDEWIACGMEEIRYAIEFILNHYHYLRDKKIEKEDGE